jgi:hypothetical protein
MTPEKLADLERIFADATVSAGVLPLRYVHYDREHSAQWSTIRYGGGAIALGVPHKVQLESQANAIVEIMNAAPALIAAAKENEALREKLEIARQYKQRLAFEKAQTWELRASLRKLVSEVDFVISGGDDVRERCAECGLAGIGMLRDARRESVKLLAAPEGASE